MNDDSPARVRPGPSARYSERLWPALWIWASVLIAGVSCGLVVLPFSDLAALIVAAVSTVLLAAALLAVTPVVGVWDGELHAGRAHVPVGLLEPATVLDRAALRHEHGPGLDMRAYLCVRGWVPTGVRIGLADPRDPTPYWLLSSRRPQHLASALEAARTVTT
jgi:hypothetical protein